MGMGNKPKRPGGHHRTESQTVPGPNDLSLLDRILHFSTVKLRLELLPRHQVGQVFEAFTSDFLCVCPRRASITFLAAHAGS